MRLSEEARLILVSLAEAPKHGYAIAQDIEAFAGRRLGPGTLYGAIARLETWGYVEALAGQARRRPYRITTRGSKALRESLDEAQRVGVTARRRLASR